MTFLIIFIGSLLVELKSSVFKKKSENTSVYLMMLIVSLFSLLIFSISLFIKWEVRFDKDSILLILIRTCFECFHIFLWVQVIKNCDRSTSSIIWILTLPLLLIVDLVLWYQISNYWILWILIICVSLVLFNIKWKTLNLKWLRYLLILAINAVITISLYKELITNYDNSFELIQIFTYIWLIIFLSLLIFIKRKEEKLSLNILKDKILLLSIIWYNMWWVLISYSYTLVTASEATSFKRVASMISGVF